MDDVLGNLIKSAKAGEFGLMEFSVSVCFSLAAGVACMLIYRLYFSKSFERNDSLTRSFIVIAPAITAIFWAIQYSLPLSLGLLGALSFVRFRTPIKKPEDIAFILLVIALSLLSSVFRFIAAGILLALVSVIVLLKAIFVEKGLSIIKFGTHVTVFVTTATQDVALVDMAIKDAVSREFAEFKNVPISLMDVVQKEERFNLRYTVYFKKFTDSAVSRLISKLSTIKETDNVEIFVGKNA